MSSFKDSSEERGQGTDNNCKDKDVDQKSIGSGFEDDLPDFETVIAEIEVADEQCTLAGNPLFCKAVTAVTQYKKQTYNPKKSLKDVRSLPTRSYLDVTLVPILIQAMMQIAEERPPSPLTAVATFLLKNRSQYENTYG